MGPEARRRSRMCAERRDCSPARDGHGTETEDLTAAQLCPGPSDFWPLPHLPMPLSALLIPYQGPSALPPSFLEKPKWGSGLRSGCGQGQARPSSPGEVSALRGTAGLQDGSSAWGGGELEDPSPAPLFSWVPSDFGGTCPFPGACYSENGSARGKMTSCFCPSLSHGKGSVTPQQLLSEPLQVPKNQSQCCSHKTQTLHK